MLVQVSEAEESDPSEEEDDDDDAETAKRKVGERQSARIKVGNARLLISFT